MYIVMLLSMLWVCYGTQFEQRAMAKAAANGNTFARRPAMGYLHDTLSYMEFNPMEAIFNVLKDEDSRRTALYFGSYQEMQRVHPDKEAQIGFLTARGIVFDAENQFIQSIDWSGKELTGSIHWEAVQQLASLKKLNLKRNGLFGLVRWELLPRRLQELTLGMNLFEGTVDLSALPRSLEHLDLRSNQFSGRLQLKDLPERAQYVSLSHNNFEGPLDLTSLPNRLAELHAECNVFCGPININQLPRTMEVLSAWNNDLTGSLTITYLPQSLQRLELGYNHFTGNIDFSHLKQRPNTHIFLEGNGFTANDFTNANDNVHFI